MKRFYKKALACLMCAVIALPTGIALAGCGPKGEEIDETRSQIYVGVYDGGYGDKWFYDLKERFEAAYKDKSFQEGRTGVQVRPLFDKDAYTPGKLFDTIKQDKNEVYFASGNDMMTSYISENYLLDLTEIVTKPLTEFNESESIEDKMDTVQIEHYKRDGKYYMLPDKETAQGVIYDADLFASKKYYFAKGGCPSEFSAYTQANNENPASGTFNGYSYTGDDAKSAGPDGKYGTYDDGCPATYEEFMTLLKRMSNTNTQPFIWYNDAYKNFLMTALSVDYHGVEQGRVLYNAGGTDGVEADIITGFNGDGSPIVSKKKITFDNYKDVSRLAGLYYGLDMMEKLIDGKFYAPETKQGYSHVETQQKFLRSSLNNKPIAMMLDGTWWDAEADASGAFAECVQDFPGKPASRDERKFGLMPMPKLSADRIGTGSTILTGSSHVFAKADIDSDKKELIETFIRFVYTDESMVRHTITSGVPVALDYDLSEENEAKLNYFAKQYWNVSKSSQKVWDYISPTISNSSSHDTYMKISEFESSANSRNFVLLALEGNSMTARQYFEGMWLK